MIQELVALAEELRHSRLKGTYVHDALDNVPVSIDLVIDRNGRFKQFIPHDTTATVAEAITAKKGKARLLVDRAEETLGYGKNAKAKHQLFINKLKEYSNLPALSPVFAFYNKNKVSGLQKARFEFPRQLQENLRSGNIAFMLADTKKRLHEDREIQKAIIDKYEAVQDNVKNQRLARCSVCGSSNYAIVDIPHGMIKRVPDGQTSGCALVSYNDTAYESYQLGGNENSAICTHCARAYVDSLNWLLAPSSWKPSDKAGKNIPIFKNRKNISDDTAVVFWLRDALEISDLELLDKPDEGKIRAMIDSVYSGQATPVKQIKPDEFYAITLSGAAARIAVRDWVETSLPSLRANLAGWFQNIEIDKYDQGRGSLVRQFPALTSLAWSTKSKSANDVQHGRIGAALWKCAVLRASPPIWVIAAVLNRIRAEQGNTTSERIALLKLYLNRRSDYQGGGYYMTTLDESNKNNAYICGRIFAVLESIQYHASGGNLNAGIRERFFSFASNMPSTAFGRLMKLSQHHLSKIRGDKPGLAVNLDRKLQELMTNIKGSSFPPVFSLEEQASFAIGYYHQRQRDFDAKSNSKEE